MALKLFLLHKISHTNDLQAGLNDWQAGLNDSTLYLIPASQLIGSIYAVYAKYATSDTSDNQNNNYDQYNPGPGSHIAMFFLTILKEMAVIVGHTAISQLFINFVNSFLNYVAHIVSN